MQMNSISESLDNAGGRNYIRSTAIKKGCVCVVRKALCKARVCSYYHVMPGIIKRKTHQQVLEVDKGGIVDRRGLSRVWTVVLMSPIALIGIYSLSCEYGINGILMIILNGMHDLTALPWLLLRRETHCEIYPGKLYNHITD